MRTSELLTKSYSVRGKDGNDLTFSETVERLEIVVSIQQNDNGGKVATVRINAEQFEALQRLFDRYSHHLEVNYPLEPVVTQEEKKAEQEIA